MGKSFAYVAYTSRVDSGLTNRTGTTVFKSISTSTSNGSAEASYPAPIPGSQWLKDGELGKEGRAAPAASTFAAKEWLYKATRWRGSRRAQCWGPMETKEAAGKQQVASNNRATRRRAAWEDPIEMMRNQRSLGSFRSARLSSGR
ncbi:hypothetical protein C8R47DRAFT_1075080 [Mycena vitilis]|nr:hypothetical protein C8R47DRAFT_1075080 [Mycena vitilis]